MLRFGNIPAFAKALELCRVCYANTVDLTCGHTGSAGETARVKLKDGDVKVLCKEIRDRSVVVQLEGAAEAKELFLNGR